MQTSRIPPMTRPFARPDDVSRCAPSRGDELPGRISVHARHPADDVPRPAVDDAAVRRLRHGRRVERPLPLSARAGRQRPERRVRSADADGLRLGPPDGRRRGRPRRRRDRLDRGHGGALRRHPARSRVDVDDDQRDGDHPARALRRGRAAAGRARSRALSGTIQNDILKEYIARGTYIYPPRHSLRIVTDIFAWCERELPNWNTISISGYHIREAGSTAVQEVAFTLANAIAYVEAARAAGLDVDRARPAAVVLLRRAQRLPRGDREVPRGAAAVGAHHARPVRRDAIRARCSCAFTRRRPAARSTAQQPDNNIVRVAIQALAAVLGGTQSLHCNGRDEALALPTEEAARIALRTQQIIAAEIGRRQHGRSGRRRVGDRAAHRRDRARGARAHRRRSTRPAARSRRSSAAGSSGRSRTRPTPRSRPSTRGDQVIVGVNRYHDRRAGRDRAAAHRSGERAAAGGGGARRCARAATPRAWQRGDRRASSGRRATARTSCRP